MAHEKCPLCKGTGCGKKTGQRFNTITYHMDEFFELCARCKGTGYIWRHEPGEE